jgi:hypothetical protein
MDDQVGLSLPNVQGFILKKYLTKKQYSSELLQEPELQTNQYERGNRRQ